MPGVVNCTCVLQSPSYILCLPKNTTCHLRHTHPLLAVLAMVLLLSTLAAPLPPCCCCFQVPRPTSLWQEPRPHLHLQQVPHRRSLPTVEQMDCSRQATRSFVALCISLGQYSSTKWQLFYVSGLWCGWWLLLSIRRALQGAGDGCRWQLEVHTFCSNARIQGLQASVDLHIALHQLCSYCSAAALTNVVEEHGYIIFEHLTMYVSPCAM
jgi:hypothetical protein